MKRVKKAKKAWDKRVISLYSTKISQAVKIRNVQKLQQDIENDLIIRDQMASSGSSFKMCFW